MWQMFNSVKREKSRRVNHGKKSTIKNMLVVCVALITRPDDGHRLWKAIQWC